MNERRILAWLAIFAVAGAVFYFVGSVLSPFVLSFLIAFILDPLCDQVEAWRVPRSLAALLVLVLFTLLVLGTVAILLPIVIQQITDLLLNLPGYLRALVQNLAELSEAVETRFGVNLVNQLDIPSGSTENLVQWLTRALGGMVSGGIAVATLLTQFGIMLVVIFFLLRDFKLMAAAVDRLLPPRYEETLKTLAGQCYDTLAGYLRGQGLVCIILGAFYATGLTLIGLRFGLLVGLLAGLISFIPYVGATVGFIVSMGLAAVEFDSLLRIAGVAGIFWAGQAIEGNLLQPVLVGHRVRLHPVWVIIALYAGGVMFGFFGILLAVPVAAVVGVLARYGVQRYLESPLFRRPEGQGAIEAPEPETGAPAAGAAPRPLTEEPAPCSGAKPNEGGT